MNYFIALNIPLYLISYSYNLHVKVQHSCHSCMFNEHKPLYIIIIDTNQNSAYFTNEISVCQALWEERKVVIMERSTGFRYIKAQCLMHFEEHFHLLVLFMDSFVILLKCYNRYFKKTDHHKTRASLFSTK